MVASVEGSLRLWCLLVSMIVVFLASSNSVAATSDDHANSSEQETADRPAVRSEKVDAVVLLDLSGSMLVTDPLKLRDQGAQLFVQSLKAGDRLAILGFSDRIYPLLPLTDLTPELSTQVAEIVGQRAADGQYTDLLAAVKGAAELLKQEARPGVEQIIVLLSDGKLEPDPNLSSAALAEKELFEVTLPDLKERKIPVHTLAFSQEADQELLRRTAQETDALSWFTPAADRLHESFSELFLAVKKPQVVGLTSKGFSIDGQVSEATFYLNREGEDQVSLKSPSGVVLQAGRSTEDITWFQGSKFDVITVRKPEIGTWQLQGVAKDGFATLLTNIKLESAWPNTIFEGEPKLLTARFYESEKAVYLPEMAPNMKFAFRIIPTDKVAPPLIVESLNDEGKNGDRVAGDNIFSALVTLEDPGEYRLEVVGRTPTFERRQHLPFRVRPRLVSVKVVTGNEDEEEGDVVESDAANGHGEKGHGEKGDHKGEESQKKITDVLVAKTKFFMVALSKDTRSFKDIDVALVATDGDKEIYKIKLHALGGDPARYSASVNALPKEGSFTLIATLTAKDARKATVSSESRPLKYLHVPEQGEQVVVKEVEAVEEELEKPEPEAPREPSTWPIHLLVLLGNCAIAGWVFKQQQKGGSSPALAIPELVIPPVVTESLKQLELRASATEVKPDELEALLAAAQGGGATKVPPRSAATVSSNSSANSSVPTDESDDPTSEAADSAGGGSSEEDGSSEPQGEDQAAENEEAEVTEQEDGASEDSQGDSSEEEEEEEE